MLSRNMSNRVRKGLASVVLLGMLAAVPLLASHAASAAEAPRADNVLRATLDNGLQVVIVRNTIAPVVMTQVVYKTGGRDTPEGFPGTAHAVEHMMFRDAQGLSGAQLSEIIGKLGADANAFTTEDGTEYYFSAPAQYVDLLLRIESIRMRGAKMAEKGWRVEKGAIEQEVSSDLSNPGQIAVEKAQAIMFAGTGYATDGLGTRPSFDKTDHKILSAFYDKWYHPNNAVLVVAGDIDPPTVLAKIKELFGGIASGNVPTRAVPQFRPFKSQTITQHTPSDKGRVLAMYRFPGEHSKDYAALSVLMDVLDNPRSRLSMLAANGKVLGTTAFAESYAHAGMGIVGVDYARGGDVKRAQHVLEQMINKVRTDGVPADLVAAVKRRAVTAFEFSKNSSTGIAQSWSDALVWRGVSSPEEELAQLQAVTVDDVNRVARKYLTPDQQLTLLFVPGTGPAKPYSNRGFGGTETFSSDTPSNVPLPAWADAALSKLELPRWTLAPVKMTLDNGITLIVQPEHASKTVTIQGRIDDNPTLQEPKGKEGVANLLDSLFSYGTTTLDRTALHSALDQISAQESAGSSFRLAVTRAEFDRGVQLLADNELHPALPAHGFLVQREALRKIVAGKEKSPEHQVHVALNKGVYPPGDPARRHPTPQSVAGLSLADVKHYYQTVFRPDMTTIVVVGDVTPAEAKAQIVKYFGNWKAVGPKPNILPQPVASNSPSYVVINDPFASQDEVYMAEVLDLNVHDQQPRYALELGNAVLGGNGFASRLFQDARAKHGYVYSIGSSGRFGRSRSTFTVAYGSDPDKVAKVDALIQKNIKSMRSEPVSAQDLLNAKQAMIRSVPQRVGSVNAIAFSLLDWSMQGLPLNEPIVAAKHYLAITAKQVRDAFKTYIHPENFVQVVRGPQPKRH